jgi:plastocyanin
MPRVMRWVTAGVIIIISISAGMMCGSLLAQDTPPVSVSPSTATIMVGDTRSFRAVDKNGHMLRDVHWTASEPAVVSLAPGDEVEITAKQVGKCTVTVHASQGFADAQVEVVGGAALPLGTVKWSAADLPGCHTIKIIPAVPSANGPDVFEQSACSDGTYVRAFTAEGILLWRRKIDSTIRGSFPSKEAAPVASMNTHASSICDSVSAGMKKDAVGELLKARNLSTAAESSENLWTVEEEGAQCKLWFDADSQVTRKRKTLTTE